MEKAVERGLDWAGLPVITTVARLLCRELTLQNECVRVESRIPREKVSARIRFTDEERRPLMRMSSACEIALRALCGTDESLDITGFILPGEAASRARAIPRGSTSCCLRSLACRAVARGGGRAYPCRGECRGS